MSLMKGVDPVGRVPFTMVNGLEGPFLQSRNGEWSGRSLLVVWKVWKTSSSIGASRLGFCIVSE